MSNSRYETREQIGKGGLGAVYKAWDTQLHREVAVKRVLIPGQASPEEVRESGQKLIAEAQTLSSLNHPNIVTVFDVGSDEQGGFVVMELLNGETLDDTIARGVLTQEDFSEVVFQTMEALIAAQAIDVIHRDIKPSNIMVIWQASGKFQTKILDFGLAKFSKSPSVQTMDQDDSVMGSIFFMAPEQFERGELDARTDLYQMGCVYYNALTGQYPFNGETGPQVMNAHMQHKVTPLEQVRPDMSPSICQWVMWLINRDLDHRPRDARDALSRWPKNPEPPGAAPVQVLPVEEVEEAPSSAVKVITHASQAAAPPQLIIPEPRTGSQPIGSQTAAGRRNTGPYRPGQHSGRISPPTKPNRMKLWVGLGSIVSAIAIFVAISSVKKSGIRKKNERLEQLVGEVKPQGTAQDVVLCLNYITDRNALRSQRADAFKVLKKLQGQGIDEKMLEEMQTSESSFARLKLADLLSERGYAPAVPAMISAFKSASKDKDRVEILKAVRGVADMKSVDQMVEALQGNHSPDIRRVFEDTVLAVLRKNNNADSVISSILAKISTSGESERKSLFRILGVMGGDKIRTQLAQIYKTKNKIDYQRDAMLAFLNWPDRTALSQVEEVIASTKDDALRRAAIRAFVHLAGLPGPEPIQERVAIWKRCFELLSDPNDARRLIFSMMEYPSPETLSLLQEFSKNKSFGRLAKSAAGTVQKMMGSVVEIQSGEPLKGNMARLQGNRRASINSFLESLTSWISPETSFSWNFKVKESGNYSIIVDQATLQKKSSSFTIFLNGRVFEGESKMTTSLEEFSPVKLEGTAALEVGKIYTLSLVAGQHIQPRMMDIGAVRLIKN